MAFTIYYFCPDDNTPVGGVKVIYQHVDALNLLGFEAYVLHSNPAYRCNWFSNSTQVRYCDEVFPFSTTDIVVMPEIFMHFIFGNNFSWKEKWKNWRGKGNKLDYVKAKQIINSDVKLVLFNQNAFYTFNNFPKSYKIETLVNRALAMLCVSDHNKSYLEYAIPNLKVYITQTHINLHLFKTKTKKKKICYMPRKNAEHSNQVFKILAHRHITDNYEIVAIDRFSESQVADALSDAMFFFSFGYPEGYGLPPAEAMASACFVRGYSGGGGRDFFNQDYCEEITFGSILEFATKAEYWINQFDINQEQIVLKGQKASEAISSNSSLENEQQSLKTAWKHIESMNLN